MTKEDGLNESKKEIVAKEGNSLVEPSRALVADDGAVVVACPFCCESLPWTHNMYLTRTFAGFSVSLIFCSSTYDSLSVCKRRPITNDGDMTILMYCQFSTFVS